MLSCAERGVGPCQLAGLRCSPATSRRRSAAYSSPPCRPCARPAAARRPPACPRRSAPGPAWPTRRPRRRPARSGRRRCPPASDGRLPALPRRCRRAPRRAGARARSASVLRSRDQLQRPPWASRASRPGCVRSWSSRPRSASIAAAAIRRAAPSAAPREPPSGSPQRARSSASSRRADKSSSRPSCRSRSGRTSPGAGARLLTAVARYPGNRRMAGATPGAPPAKSPSWIASCASSAASASGRCSRSRAAQVGRGGTLPVPPAQRRRAPLAEGRFVAGRRRRPALGHRADAVRLVGRGDQARRATP